jgi:WD40 repeat protein
MEIDRDHKRYCLVVTFAGHGGLINTFSFNSNGSLLASGGDDEEVQIWDLNVFRQYQTLADRSGPWGQITCIKFLRSTGDPGGSGDSLCFGMGHGYLLLYHRQRRAVGAQNITVSTGY